MINNVILLGRLTKDPELITSEKGNKRLVINLAVDRDYKIKMVFMKLIL